MLNVTKCSQIHLLVITLFDFLTVLIDYRFGIASLSNKKELLQVNDPVQFNADLNEEFAMNIHATREKLRAMVEAMKGKFFLKNIFFL